MYRYAQIDESGRCVSVSFLSGKVESDLMILLDDEDDVMPRDIFDGETWTRPDPPPQPDPGPSPTERIAQLEDESAMLALELVDTQTRLEQAESEQAALLLELVDKGVL